MNRFDAAKLLACVHWGSVMERRKATIIPAPADIIRAYVSIPYQHGDIRTNPPKSMGCRGFFGVLGGERWSVMEGDLQQPLASYHGPAWRTRLGPTVGRFWTIVY